MNVEYRNWWHIAHIADMADIQIKPATTMVSELCHTGGYTVMWCACACACKKKKASCRGGISSFSHTSAIFTYNKGLWMIGSCPSWDVDGTLALALQQVILSDDLEAPFQDLLDWSSSAVAMRALTAKRKTHSGIELKQTTRNFYSQSTVNTSIQTLGRWSKPRFFDQMANRSS